MDAIGTLTVVLKCVAGLLVAVNLAMIANDGWSALNLISIGFAVLAILT